MSFPALLDLSNLGSAEEMLQRRRHQAAYLSHYGSSPERSWAGVPVVEFEEAYREMNEIIAAEHPG